MSIKQNKIVLIMILILLIKNFQNKNLANAFENTVSVTSGPHIGKIPLHLVLAFCKAPLT